MGAIRTREVSPRLVGGHPRGQTAPFAGSLGLCRGAGSRSFSSVPLLPTARAALVVALGLRKTLAA